jgi:hypothetical protein
MTRKALGRNGLGDTHPGGGGGGKGTGHRMYVGAE